MTKPSEACYSAAGQAGAESVSGAFSLQESAARLHGPELRVAFQKFLFAHDSEVLDKINWGVVVAPFVDELRSIDKYPHSEGVFFES